MTRNAGAQGFRSLNNKLLVAILLVSAFFTLIATAVQLYSDYRRDVEQLDRRIHAIESSHLPALSLAIWSLDSGQIETQLASVLSLPDVDAALLESQHGESYGSASLPDGMVTRDYTFTLFNDGSQAFKLGTLTLRSDIKRIDRRFWDRVTVILVTNGLRTFFVAIAILLLVRVLVTRHLVRISNYFGELSLARLDQPLRLRRAEHGPEDELDRIAHSVNTMRKVFERDVRLMEEIRDNLRISEEKYRLAMEATQDGLWDWNIVTGDVYFSPGWASILGIVDLEQNYASWEERIHPDDRDTVLTALQRHIESGSEIWQEEHRLRHASGEWVWVLGRGRVVGRNAAGQALRMIGTMTDIQAKKDNEQVIWRQANFDALTGLPNRKLFLELLGQGIRQAARKDERLWLLFVDLDGFKEVNDALGHHAGDLVLQEIGRRIKGQLRVSDTVARLGGDEFVILVSRSGDIDGVDTVAGKLVTAVAVPCHVDNVVVHVTASIGIASYPMDAEQAEDLLRFADQSMYVAKQEGKNRFVYFTPAMQSAALLRKRLREEMHDALLKRQFVPYYQPIVDLETGRLVKAELLLRWQHPEHGLVGPSAFIQIAEENGLIQALGDWVIGEAAKQLQTWLPACPGLKLAINMSPLQIKNPAQEESLREAEPPMLADYGRHLVIEITEGLLLDGDRRVKERLGAYHRLGVEIAIDDFGTGYSNLSYLREFAIDYLKIDRAFTRRLADGAPELSICKAIIAMADGLGLGVIAEGVETEGQRDILQGMGCRLGQGYLFSRPVPADEFEQRFLRDVPHELGA